VKPSDIPFEVGDADIVLVDDVLHTGRTIRAAMNELFDYGRPQNIRLAALVDRGGRQLPIAAQFIGAEVSVPDADQIELKRNDKGRLSLVLNRPDPA
jgi:pyrimidine operon attenuation protein/uracil phosphoribosyltransferase